MPSPAGGSPEVVDLMLNGWMKRFGGGIEFEPDTDAIIAKTLAHIDKKRVELGLTEYDAKRFGESGDRLMDDLLEEENEGEPMNIYSRRKQAVGSEV
jgi:hypothetical protein